MSVVEFSADSWQASSPGLQEGLSARIEALSELSQGLESLAGSGNISGVGADAMRAYIREVHIPIVQSLLVSLYTFQTAIGVYWNGYSQVDGGGNFRLVNDEFDTHVTQLDIGMEQLQGFATDLRAIAANASHLVSLGDAGAGAAERAAEGFERMRSVARTQQETWAAYEATDPGFAQVKSLLTELNGTVQNVGSLTVGQGRSYQSGSFTLTLARLGELTSGMRDYCEQNQQAASNGWDTLFSGYVDDVHVEQERKRTEDAAWGLLWDSLQIAAGVVVTTIGVGLTPFTGGVSLGLTVLGGSLLVGGINSAINHTSIVTTGNDLNLIGMAAGSAAQWYDVNVAQPAIASGDTGLQFLAGAGSGVLQVASDAVQLNVQQIGTGMYALATSDEARSGLWNQLTTIAGQVADGDAFVIGQIAGNLVPFGAAAKLGKPGTLLSKVDNLGGGGGGKLPDFTPVTISTPNAATSAFDWLKSQHGGTGVKVSDEFTPTVRKPDGVDGTVAKPTVPGDGDELPAGGKLSTLTEGEFPRAGETWRGQTEGGPGTWEKSSTRTRGVEYQEFITRMERGTEYRVNGVYFDGYDPVRNVLTDAKDWKNYPPSGTVFWHKGTLKEVRLQIRAAGETPIEWHLSTAAAKREVDLLLQKYGLQEAIQTIVTPSELQ
ncbi:hypothetical protein HQQ80_16855 [Microbacteriaceae bacterium VKM Ac-2855]|nr:hypothetical protein [Microbacteriaceae bacterium VKM Ac-2855]